VGEVVVNGRIEVDVVGRWEGVVGLGWRWKRGLMVVVGRKSEGRRKGRRRRRVGEGGVIVAMMWRRWIV